MHVQCANCFYPRSHAVRGNVSLGKKPTIPCKGAGSARFNGTSINFSGRGGVPILAHEIGHTIFGGGYVDFLGQKGCPSCPVGNVQTNENSVRRDLGKRLRNWYPNPNGGKNYFVGEVWERNW